MIFNQTRVFSIQYKKDIGSTSNNNDDSNSDDNDETIVLNTMRVIIGEEWGKKETDKEWERINQGEKIMENNKTLFLPVNRLRQTPE